jgi:hypothetical protein
MILQIYRPWTEAYDGDRIVTGGGGFSDRNTFSREETYIASLYSMNHIVIFLFTLIFIPSFRPRLRDTPFCFMKWFSLSDHNE